MSHSTLGGGSSGGIQYAEGVTSSISTGTMVMWKDDTDVVFAAQPSSPLPVSIQASTITDAVNLTKVGGTAISLGQAVMASSLPVAIASNQGNVPVSQSTASALNATVVGTGTFATQATLQTQTDTVMVGGVNIKEINAATPLMGNGTTGTGSLRVTVASDNTAFSVNATQSTSPWIVAGGGTAGTAATGVVTIQGIASMTKLLVTPDANSAINMAQINAHTALEGGTNGSLAIGGTVATNVAITANPINLGAQAVSSENSAVTTARQVQLVADLVGKLIVLPYANPENFVSGVATATDTTSTSLIGSPGGSLRNYITQITVWNSSATATYIKIQNGSSGTTLYDIPAPAGGGATLSLPTPLRQPTTATAIYFAANASANAVFVSASGYKGL